MTARGRRPPRPPLTQTLGSGRALTGHLRAAWGRGGAAHARQFPAEVGRDRRRVGRRVSGQQHRGPPGLAEVEILLDVAQDGLVLAYVRPRVGAAVGSRVEACAVEEVVRDEL